MNVLSLFDGISGAMVALERLNIPIKNYFSSEIDKYCIQISKKNYPNIIQLGDVKNISAANLPKINLLIGGSPCQGFSFAGKQLNFDDPRSALFWEFVRILKELKPDYFLLENVRMKKDYQDVITEALGVEPLLLNSSLISAQSRKRNYWTNIKNVTPPANKKIFLQDILLDSSESIGAFRGRYIEDGKRKDLKSVKGLTRQYLEVRKDSKSNTLTTVSKDNIVIVKNINPSGRGQSGNVYLADQETKSPTLTTNKGEGIKVCGRATDINGHDLIKRIYSPEGKSPTLTAGSGGNQEPKVSENGFTWRKILPIEAERLQTFPDNFTSSVSTSQRFKALGNSFTVDMIKHILSFM